MKDPHREIREKIESCSACRGFHESLKKSFCQLVKTVNPTVRLDTCYTLFDQVTIEGKLKPEEMCQRLGLRYEDCKEIFKYALSITEEAYREAIKEAEKRKR